MTERILRAMASLKLSIILLALAMVLIYAGTWAQIDTGIYEVQTQYFHSWIARVPLGVVLPRTADGSMMIPGILPMPGGYAIGLVMLLNLLANWLTRYRRWWNQMGLHLVHAALVLLLLGEAWSSVAQVDGRLVLKEGQTKAYTEDARQMELAVMDRTPADYDQVHAISDDLLRPGNVIRDASLPMAIRVEEYAANCVVTVLDGNRERGTFLLPMSEPPEAPQKATLENGRERWLQLRPKRYPKPYELTLLSFKHDRYPGTDRAKSYSSRLRLVDAERGIDREEVVWMNHPLRHRGETFYQASFSGEDTTVLQVVHNPAMLVPYIACAVGALGMVVQFGIGVGRFVGRRRGSVLAAVAACYVRPSPAAWVVPALIGLACLGIMVWQANRAMVDPTDIAAAPVYDGGRLQPLDSLARNSLRAMNGKAGAETISGDSVGPVDWLLDVVCRPESAMQYKMLRIDNAEVLSMLKLDAKRNCFPPSELEPGLPELQRQVAQAMQMPAGQRDLVQRKVLELWEKLQILDHAGDWPQLYLLPPLDGSTDWRQLGPVLKQAQAAGSPVEPLAEAIASSLGNHREAGPTASAQPMGQWVSLLDTQRPAEMGRMRLEVMYNRYQPFGLALGLNVLVFLLACASLLVWRTTLWRSAMVVAVLALLVHTAAMGVRMYLQGRPPVTNLYSSAIFIGWGAVLLAVLIELVYRNGIALTMASLVGSATLVIAQNLAQGGDTMPAMEAVLDSNFWLTTHVLAITYGYSAAFVAGAMGMAFVIAGIVARERFTSEHRASLGWMIYGTACFALLFSFVGTLLGGIWADQSWGRFWGWDPKENGAALIVLWIAIMLHARWVGAGPRGIALLAVFANVVTAWSWFGTNMLGVGLHSYGFMDSALMWLLLFVFSQLFIIAVGLIWCRRDQGVSSASKRPQCVTSGTP